MSLGLSTAQIDEIKILNEEVNRLELSSKEEVRINLKLESELNTLNIKHENIVEKEKRRLRSLTDNEEASARSSKEAERARLEIQDLT